MDDGFEVGGGSGVERGAGQSSDSCQLASALQCSDHENVLAQAFEPWWDHQIPVQAFHDICRMVRGRYSQAFMGAIVDGRVFWKCCSGDCEDTGMVPLDKAWVKDKDVLLTLIAEVAKAASLPDMYFLFNTGDQPFTDKMYFSPVPQLHWVSCAGHWTIPLPNPFQLSAHVKNLLGDSAAHEARQVPWAQKISKVFWRGSLSAPDHILGKDIQTLPRVRLLNMAAQHPELFDVALTSVDSEMEKTFSKSELAKLLQQLRQTDYTPDTRELPRHRYIINVSAVLSSWRLVQMLASGSLLLLQEDASRELVFDWLTPWVHFVPVRNNLSDLVSTLRWLEEHEEEGEAIAARGYELFKKRVRRQDTYCYLWQALGTLAKMTQSAPLPRPEALLRKGKWKEVDAGAVYKAQPSHVGLAGLLQELQGSSTLEL